MLLKSSPCGLRYRIAAMYFYYMLSRRCLFLNGFSEENKPLTHTLLAYDWGLTAVELGLLIDDRMLSLLSKSRWLTIQLLPTKCDYLLPLPRLNESALFLL